MKIYNASDITLSEQAQRRIDEACANMGYAGESVEAVDLTDEIFGIEDEEGNPLFKIDIYTLEIYPM